MQIGEVIRTYRKSKNMTQEEMANRLGVTAPAVNKWENGNSLPDIMLLAPIARLLNITLDTLLSFREELSAEEINSLIVEADDKLKHETFEEAFRWAKEKIEMYPNCERLIWQLAVVFDAWRLTHDIPKTADYEDYIFDCYTRALNSKDEDIRNAAADSLFGFYLRKEQYKKAEECLVYFSKRDPERKRKQAAIYSETDRMEEAYKAYEELLFSGYQMINMVFHGIYMLAMKEKDMEKARVLIRKQEQLSNVFEMGRYHEASVRLEVAVAEKDADATIESMKKVLESVGELCVFCRSSLYEHMTFREPSEEFIADVKKNLLERFRDDEAFGFLNEDERWKELVG